MFNFGKGVGGLYVDGLERGRNRSRGGDTASVYGYEVKDKKNKAIFAAIVG